MNQKDLRLGRGSFIAIKENHCSHSGGARRGHIRNSGRGCIFSDTIHMGAVNRSSVAIYVSYAKRLRFLYKGIIIKHNKTEPTYTKTSLFLCEKRRFFMARTEKGVVTTI